MSSRLKAFCTLPTSADSKTVKLAFTVGMRSARVNPRSMSRCLTVLTNVARLTLTALFCTVTAPLCPWRAATSCWCALRFASSQACANTSLVTSCSIRSWAKFWTPLTMGPDSAWTWAATAGGRMSRCEIAVSAWLVMPWTSTYWKTRLVRLFVTACWTAGSCASGATVST